MVFFLRQKSKKFCIIENNLNNSLNDILKKRSTYISIYKLNIFILFKLIYKKKFNFIKNFLKLLPRVDKILSMQSSFSMIDNNENILKIKNFHKNIKVAVVQNGTRYLNNDISNFKVKRNLV